MDEQEASHLVVERFSGREIFNVDSATWRIFQGEDESKLILDINCDGASSLSEELSEIGDTCGWELYFSFPNLESKSIQKGFEAKIPKSFDDQENDYVTNFYFVQHEGTDDNEMRVLDRKGDMLLIELTGTVIDLNYYDDSKPRSVLSLKVWFSSS